MLEEKGDDSNVDDQLQQLLQEAGLESVPIDPASLEALKSIVSDKEDFSNQSGYFVPDETSTVRATDENCPPMVSYSLPPVSEVRQLPYELKRYTSEITSPSSAAESIADESSLAFAPSFTKIEGASDVENQILEQLHNQTRLLVNMQRRIDELTATVEVLTKGGVVPSGVHSGAGIPARKIPDKSPVTFASPPGRYFPPPSEGAARDPHAQAQGQAPPAQLRAAVRPNNNNDNNNNRGGMLMAIRNSALFKIIYLFWALRRRYVQELDGGLIFKIIFMMAILTARMSSSSSAKKHDPEFGSKLAFLVLLVIAGFLMQSGYLQYVYTFFVKENFPERVFNGEDVNDIVRNPNGPVNAEEPNGNNNNNNNNNQGPPLPRGRLPPNHPARANDGGFGGWRNTFLGGIIPEADNGGVVGAIKDVALLFGSFLLSIFPMWAPEGPPQPRREQPRQPEEDVQPPGGLAAGPGEVRPPRDVLQPADDSDDEN